MTDDDSDVYRVDGSKVWLSPTAVAYAREYFGPGRQGVQQMAQYLRLRHQMQQAALSPSGIGVHSDELSSYLAAPSGEQQEYEATTGDAQQEQPPSDMALPDDMLPSYRPLD